jgi:hypothetical protein
MARARERGNRTRSAHRAGVGVLIVVAVLALVGCSPEDGRTRGSGPGADVGNTSLPIRMHGDRGRNNPSFQVPLAGGVPRDARGVPGWWVSRR